MQDEVYLAEQVRGWWLRNRTTAPVCWVVVCTSHPVGLCPRVPAAWPLQALGSGAVQSSSDHSCSTGRSSGGEPSHSNSRYSEPVSSSGRGTGQGSAAATSKPGSAHGPQEQGGATGLDMMARAASGEQPPPRVHLSTCLGSATAAVCSNPAAPCVTVLHAFWVRHRPASASKKGRRSNVLVLSDKALKLLQWVLENRRWPVVRFQANLCAV